MRIPATALLTGALTLSLNALASEGFYDLREIRRFTQVHAAASAAPMISGTGIRAGGAYISSTGYYLTALHNIKSCLLEKGLIKERKSSYPNLQIDIATTQTPAVTCDSIKVQGHSAQVVFIGKGYSLFQEEYLPYYDKEDLLQFQKNFSDFAILKVEIDKPVPCLQTQDEVGSDDSLFGIGYPGTTSRPGGKNALGSVLKITEGRKLSGLKGSGFEKHLVCAPGETHSPSEILEHAERLLINDRVLVTDNDNFPGMSGGPMVTQEGRLIGEIFALIGSTPERTAIRYSKGSTLVLSAKAIKDEIRMVAGEEAVSKYFSCKALK